MKYIATIKMDLKLPFSATWLELKYIMLNEEDRTKLNDLIFGTEATK